MFGYVRPFKAEMLVREYEQYKSIYCGLCRMMGKEYGALCRITLSYDCTLYALLLLSLKEENLCFERKRCVANPLKKCNYCKSGDDEWKKASALSVLLTYYKLLDDIADNSFFAGLRSRVLLPVASVWQKKAVKKYPQLNELCKTYMEAQRKTEADPNFIFDQCADPTAQMMAALLSSGSEGSESRILSEFGYHLGRWIYFMDAADDIEKDLKKGQFNPFVKRWDLHAQDYEENKKEIHIKCNEVLNFSLSQAVSAMQLLSFRSMGSIVENVVAKGLPEMQRVVLFTERKVKANDRSV